MRRFFSRAALGAVLFVTLAAVGPGAVGDCNAQTAPASAGEYCKARTAALCFRYDAEHPVNPTASPYIDPANCATGDAIVRYCASQSPFTTCIPTDLQAEACVEAIYSSANAYTTLTALPECNFCGG